MTSHRAQLPSISAPDDRATSPAGNEPRPAEERIPSRSDRVSLLWRVFAANILVFVAAFALLAWTPVTVHRVATPGELVILTIGLALMLLVDLVLLSRAFAPLRRLATVMGAVDPGQPGRRAPAPRGAGREVIALANALNEMLDRLEGERRDSGRRALEAQEAERKRIARELHDEIGQTLTAVALRAQRAAGGGSTQHDELTEIADTVLRSLEDVQRIGRELRPEALDDLGLVNALIVLCQRVDERAGPRVSRELEWSLPSLSPEVELVIYRVAQEALTNAQRHADASTVTVSLKRSEGAVVLTVSDDGRGLVAQVSESGLRGMRERSMLIDAELEIRSPPGGGTEIALTVPAEIEQP